MKSTDWMAVLGVALLSAACAKKEVQVHEEVRPVRSTVVAATPGSVGASYSGQVRARYESKLGFQTSGRVVARLVDVGSAVKRGQVLMRLDPAQEALQVVSAVADVDAARSRVAELRVELQRTEQLLARQFASQTELDKQRQALTEAESQLTSAQARQQIKVNQRGYTEVVADRDGVVTALGAEVGQVVSPGQAVVTVAAQGEREVVVSVPESRVFELQQARALQVSVWAQPHKRYEGTLRELAPDTDSVTRTYSARIAVKDADAALMLGMTASVFAPDVGGSTAIRLPLTAVLNKDGRSLVWVVDSASSRVSPQPVELSGAQNDSVIVASGLAGGETVVTAGVHMLHDGQKVAVLGTPAGANELAPVAKPDAAVTPSRLAQGARP
jgi:membrane fusion protein, multidrug efflux system